MSKPMSEFVERYLAGYILEVENKDALLENTGIQLNAWYQHPAILDRNGDMILFHIDGDDDRPDELIIRVHEDADEDADDETLEKCRKVVQLLDDLTAATPMTVS